jgi:hypothetical protein
MKVPAEGSDRSKKAGWSGTVPRQKKRHPSNLVAFLVAFVEAADTTWIEAGCPLPKFAQNSQFYREYVTNAVSLHP